MPKPVTEVAADNRDRICEIEEKLALLSAAERTIWRLKPGESGDAMRWEVWGGGESAPHGPLADIFTNGPFGNHVNGAPTSSGTHDDNTYVDATLEPTAFGEAQTRACRSFVIDQPALLRDVNNNTGEMAQVFIGLYGSSLNLVEETNNSTPTSDRVLLHDFPIQPGKYFMCELISDLSANGGFALEISFDSGATWSRFNDTQAEDFQVECDQIGLCDEIPEGWVTKEIDECVLPTFGSSDDTECTKVCPVEVGELEGYDSPANINSPGINQVGWGGWQSSDDSMVAVSGNQAEIVGDACRAHVTVSILLANLDGGAGATGNAQRAAPIIWIYRNGQPWALAAHTYMRDATGHDQSSAQVDRWDMNPAGAVYDVRVGRENIATNPSGQGTGTVENPKVTNTNTDIEMLSYFQVAAFREVAACDDEGGDNGPGGSVEPSLPAAAGKIVSDNFQDGAGNAPFNLQVRNTTGGTVDWEAFVENVPYDDTQIALLNAGAYTVQSAQNPDGTWNHLFSGFGLGPFANIIITGPLMSPPGDGSGLSLYCLNQAVPPGP